MKAAILAAGSEMLGATRVDTNSLRVAALLEEYSITLARKSVVGDQIEDLVDELRFLLDRSDLIVTSGGLGPTSDDLTREAIAAAIGIELQMSGDILAWLQQRYAGFGKSMPDANRKQALIFPGQQVLHNERGSAPGAHLVVNRDGREVHIWMFPGVPPELDWMMETYLRPWLDQLGRRPRIQRTFKISGYGESWVEDQLVPFYAAHPELPVTILATNREIHVCLAHDGDPVEGENILQGYARELEEIFGEHLFAYDADTLESVVGSLLAQRGETVATAESCTAGGLSERITSVPGSSAWFIGGVVAYDRNVKMMMLGVDPAAIEEDGEVSERVAIQMAEGARRRFGVEWGVGITGIAGPGGGSPEKPVGTVHIAIAWRGGHRHLLRRLPGDREAIRGRATAAALDLLRREILRVSRGA